MRTFGNVSSSETTRKMSVISSKYPNWFVDFSEGDGSFSCDRNAKRLFFRIRKKDQNSLSNSQLVVVWFCLPRSGGYFSFQVSSKHQIKLLIDIFNGNLVLSKTNSRFVSEWLDNYNHWFHDNITYSGPTRSLVRFY